MIDQTLHCLTDASPTDASPTDATPTDATPGALPLHTVRPPALEAFLAGLPGPQRAFLAASGFAAKAGELRLLPGPEGLSGAVFGLGDDRSPHIFGGLPGQLPERSVWRLASGDHDISGATLGFALGSYRYTGIKPSERELAKLVAAPDQVEPRSIAAASWMVRDLINTPPNLLGPVELADAARALGERYGAAVEIVEAPALDELYPTIAAVGRGSARPPRVATIKWRGSNANESSPLVSLCGKGVCFDTGGYDLKPSAGMLRMKKDMGGAAVSLGIARLVMESDMPVRLVTRIGCVENSVSGTAMRPSDVIRTRSGLTVEIGNTDAEGRLVLCDLLTDASAEQPSVLFDFATLTGAARVALGPDLPALFCDDDAWAGTLCSSGLAVFDPVWRLPFWAGYDDWLKSPVADLNNVSSRPFAGAIVAALFLKRFVTEGINHAHFDLYGWNDQTRPGRPEGGEAQVMRGVFAALKQRFGQSSVAGR
jgi:leucyl aminopeptidase